ncbi:MAG: phosphatidylserine/phosphatidylglycerophosphate/cardiolipin synthase family protein [Bdellovibrionaceae bacterium]|nr:phosphatidylserine/phosphatidylglycerophosphate/cardiolipin synthase family protein [Pseudobdellovibrionaceae bacterium]
MASENWTLRRFHHSGDEYFSDMLHAIRHARRSILVETYIFEWDSLTRLLMEELRRARERGCEVKILVDGFGSFYWLETLAQECREAGIELRVWKPLPRGFLGLQSLIRRAGFRVTRLLRQFNRRNHRKLTLIDERLVFLGSMNWTQVHCERLMGLRAWRDSGVALEGPAVQHILRAMRLAWRRAGRSQPLRKAWRRGLRDPRYKSLTSAVRLNQSWKDRRHLTSDLLRRLRRSQQRVRIESAYFLPTRALLVALKKAARRGVPVEVIQPGPSDVPAVKWAAAAMSRNLIKAGVRLYEYQPRILHAKFLIIDGWAALGSTNMNHRSFFHDLEVEAVFEDAADVEGLNRQWQADRRLSRVLTEIEINAAPWWQRWLESWAFRLRWFL